MKIYPRLDFINKKTILNHLPFTKENCRDYLVFNRNNTFKISLAAKDNFKTLRFPSFKEEPTTIKKKFKFGFFTYLFIFVELVLLASIIYLTTKL